MFVMVGMFFLVLRLGTSLGVVILGARQRMWSCMLVGLTLLVVEPWTIVAVRGDGPGAARVAVAYVVMPGLAVLGWAAGHRFRARHGDSPLRREVSHLPLLHPILVLFELLFFVALQLAS